MNFNVIKALVAKDFSLFFRNKFYTFISIIGLVVYLVIYFVMPPSVDEELGIGVYAPVMPPAFKLVQQDEGVAFEMFDSEDALKDAVTAGDYAVGMALPADIMDKFNAGEKPNIVLYYSSDAPDEIKDTVEVMVRELAYMQTGHPLAIDVSAEVLGPDMLGAQIATRDRMRLMLAIMLIMFEMLGLASLIAEEVEAGTIRALLVTPMSTRELFAAKLIMGVGLTFTQGVLFMAIVGGLNHQPIIVLLALLLGSILFTGSGFLIASISRDMLSSMGWGIVVLLIYSIPSFGIMFPGIVTGWAKVIPSYYLTDILHKASNFNAGWGDVWLNMLILTGFIAVVIWAGTTVLRRKFQ